jgi:hypothetical protein
MTMRGSIRFLAHDVVNESTKRGLARLQFAAAKDHSPMDIPGRQVLQHTGTLVLVFNALDLWMSNGQRRM